jgi:predicted short-subunit dehydrogenase-like oxidoreductase (DUF2520 family)
MKSLSTPNPFVELLATLDSKSWQVVTLNYLNTVANIVNKPQTIVISYGEAFKILEFLADAGAIELVPDETQPGVHKLRKKPYGNQAS